MNFVMCGPQQSETIWGNEGFYSFDEWIFMKYGYRLERKFSERSKQEELR